MIFLFFLLSLFNGIFCDYPIVQTKLGPVQGFTLTSYSGKEVHAFFGVPYGKPPVGERKFKKPEPVEPWTETIKAFNVPNACFREPFLVAAMMDIPEQSDDCLYLTITVPKGTPDKKIPVLVRIHGGAYAGGSAASPFLNATTLTAEENIIVVSMNYRLSIMGFLYLGTHNAPGNMGLWDQSLALKWVKDNIESFGGDPDSITLMGESAGAASISLHTLSTHSMPYFNRAILESGLAMTPWAVQPTRKIHELGIQVAAKTGCLKPSVDDMVECLRGVDSSVLVAEAEKLHTGDDIANINFAPIVDRDLITEPPRELFEQGHYMKCDYLVGTSADEGIQFVEKFFREQGTNLTEREDLRLFSKMFSPDPLIMDVIDHVYLNWTNPDLLKNLFGTADKIYGDHLFTCPATDFAELATKDGLNVFRHVFAEQLPFGGDYYAFHAVQVAFVYGVFFSKDHPVFPHVQAYEEISRRMMRTHANFVRTGDPNKSPDGTSEVSWPKYTSDSHEYLTFKGTEDTVGYGYRDNACAFWRVLLPKLVKEQENCHK